MNSPDASARPWLNPGLALHQLATAPDFHSTHTGSTMYRAVKDFMHGGRIFLTGMRVGLTGELDCVALPALELEALSAQQLIRFVDDAPRVGGSHFANHFPREHKAKRGRP